MHNYSLLVLLLFAVLSPLPTIAQDPLAVSFCANPTSFTTCRRAGLNTARSCYRANCPTGSVNCVDENNCESSDVNCTNKCICAAYENWIGCALEFCWNAVYTCEYMQLLIRASRVCPSAGVNVQFPYYAPALDGSTPNSCSCDIYSVIDSYRKADAHRRTCFLEGGNTADARRNCNCCAASKTVSTFLNICPRTLPRSLPFFPLSNPDPFETPSYQALTSPACASAFSSNLSCSALNFSTPGPAGSQFFTPANLPVNGTEPLSNTPGTLTAPVGGSTVTWTYAVGTTRTFTVALATTASGSGSGTSASGTASGTASSAASGTSSGAAASSTQPSSANKRTGGSAVLSLIGFVVGALLV